MKALRSRISTFLLAVLVLSSTFSFAIEKHYCHGEVVDYSFFGVIEDCCGNDLNNTEVTLNCCANVKELIHASNDELQIPLYEDGYVVYCCSLAILGCPIAFEFDVEPLTFPNYLPPDISKDVQVLYQTFLI
ncbi:hypothetical protein MWU59_11025 [Flavobacteriaceae bacterium F08102]|nr:hypothetical protein [Flavobacteriaceae bacterium F08102]